MAMDQQMPAEGQDGGQDGGGQLSSLLQNITQGIAMLGEVTAEVSPQMAQRVAAIQKEMDGIIAEITQGGAVAGGEEQAAGGQVPVEAGAGGVPQSPAMR